MELKQLLSLIQKSWKLLVLFVLLFVGAGFASFKHIPQKYLASGSLLVSRRTVLPTTLSGFSYEGYYAQQTARGYTETLIGFLESTDARRKALERLGIEPNEYNLRQARRSTKVKKSAPQVVSLEVKSKAPYSAEDYWEALVAEVLDISSEFNQNYGDPAISVNLVDGSPVVYEAYRNVYLNVLIGAGLGLVFGLFVILTKEYLK